ncbi:MAG: translation initiation factor [Cyanobacteria bacterium P01_A01_bin.123]
MSSRKKKSSDPNRDRVAYQEFGQSQASAFARGVPDLPPNQQSIKVEASRKGRKGKTVTIVSGFQHKPETLTNLAKDLKAQCGSGGTVKDNTLEIQGDHRDKLVTLLKGKGYQVKISGG